MLKWTWIALLEPLFVFDMMMVHTTAGKEEGNDNLSVVDAYRLLLSMDVANINNQ